MMGRTHAAFALAGVVAAIFASALWHISDLNATVAGQRQQIEATAAREGALRAAIAGQNAEVMRMHDESAARMKAAERARAVAIKARTDHDAAADRLLRIKTPEDECDALRTLVDAAVAADLDRLRARAN